MVGAKKIDSQDTNSSERGRRTGQRAQETYVPAPTPIRSFARILVFSLVASLGVLGLSLLLQWLVYADWLGRTGPLRIVGTSIATVITFAFVLRWQYSAYQRQQEMLRRLESISRASDRIRNALQAIACVSFVNEPELTEQVRQALDIIDDELRGVVREVGLPSILRGKRTKAAAKAAQGSRKSA